MFKKNALKLYRKASRFEQNYGSKMVNKIIFGRIWYKIFTQPMIKILFKIHKKSKKNRILFDAEPDFSGNAKALYDYMIENGYNKKYRITWLVDEPEEYKTYKTKNVRFVKRISSYHRFPTLKCCSAAVKARYVFFTKYFSWLEVRPKDQVRIELWHGCGMRAATEKEKELIEFDYCTVPGDAFVSAKAKFFGCAKKKILPIGEARYDKLYTHRQEADQLYKQLAGEHSTGKTVLWMPLYRKSMALAGYKTGAASMMGLPLVHSIKDMPALNALCEKNQIHLVIYCNPDMQVLRKEVGNLSCISFVSAEDCRAADADIYEILPKFDALLSDFSAVSIDYLLVDKPIGYILEDYEAYKEANGFIFKDPLAYMPGEHIYSWAELETFFAHVAAGEDDYKQARMEVRAKTHNETEGYCKRILEEFHIG